MMNKINNILIGLLWLLAVTLGTTFWFNTMFGFNIFSIQHWQHLAYIQATGQSVKPMFYISIVVAVLIAFFGLYKLLQPRFRQITIPVFDCTNRSSNPDITIHQSVQQPIQTPAVQSDIPTTERPQPSVTQNINTAQQDNRPPHLNIPTVTRTQPIPRVPLSSGQQISRNPETEYTDIRNIFESAGYVYKGMPKIKNVQTATVAIGTGEVLWIGAIGVKNADMQRAIQTLVGVFTDTLDDIEIHINAFLVAAPDASDAPSDILQFANTDDLRNYIAGIPNTPPDEDEVENFDAYSGYIGTVMDYIGKI